MSQLPSDSPADHVEGGCVCAECGHEQPTMARCARCRSFRVIPISVARREFGEDWRATCFPTTAKETP